MSPREGLNKKINSTVWESQIRSDGLAGWVNEWIIADSDSKVKIGSNKFEWSTEEDYRPSESTLYGSYVLYCQQTNRSAKSPQNFSAELLELVNRILGWKAKKTRIKINGQTTRVIEGLKLRSKLDNQPTVEEILEGDNLSDNLSDNLKALSNIESDNGDNLKFNFEENKNNFLPPCDSQIIGTHIEEVENNISFNASEVVTPVISQVQPGIEAVTEVVTPAVTEVVTEINWQSYPYQSRDTFTLKSRANKVKERVLACTTQNELITLYAEGKVSGAEIDWLKSNLLTTAECQQLEAIKTTKQTNLFDNSDQELTVESVKQQISTEVKRIGWSKQTAISYIQDKYSVSRRQDMTIKQLIELLDYLRGLTVKKLEENFDETNQ